MFVPKYVSTTYVSMGIVYFCEHLIMLLWLSLSKISNNNSLSPASGMARLDQVITNIVDIFLEYADDEGKKHQLNKEELKKVLQQEMQSPELKVSGATLSSYMLCTDSLFTQVRLCVSCSSSNCKNLYQGNINADDIEEAMEMLDKNHDGEVNFREFCRCVSVLAKCYYHKKTGKGGKRCKGKEHEGEQED